MFVYYGINDFFDQVIMVWNDSNLLIGYVHSTSGTRTVRVDVAILQQYMVISSMLVIMSTSR